MRLAVYLICTRFARTVDHIKIPAVAMSDHTLSPLPFTTTMPILSALALIAFVYTLVVCMYCQCYLVLRILIVTASLLLHRRAGTSNIFVF